MAKKSCEMMCLIKSGFAYKFTLIGLIYTNKQL